jgi:hypothetical protein
MSSAVHNGIPEWSSTGRFRESLFCLLIRYRGHTWRYFYIDTFLSSHWQ